MSLQINFSKVSPTVHWIDRGAATRSLLRAGKHVVYIIHGQSVYKKYSSADSAPVKGATLVTITSSIGSMFGDRLGRDGLLVVLLLWAL